MLDGANGMAGPMIAPMLERLPVTVHPYNLEPDGHFPNHEPNPLLEENRQFIMGKVREHGADLGIAWDGDADRCFFIDDTGEFVPGDLITALIARSMLEQHPGLDDRLRPAGVVGGARHRRRGRRHGAREPRRPRLHQGPHPQGGRRLRRRGLGPLLLPRLLLLRHGRRAGTRHARAPVAVAGKPLSELLAPFRERYHISGEINSTVADVPVKLQQLKERYSDQAVRVSHMDGISFEFEDWHFNVRPSNTEPLLRLNLEALDGPTMEARRDEVLDLIRG